LSIDNRFGGLLVHKDQLAKDNRYYHRIHPTEAAEVDARLAAEKVKADAKAKADAEAKAKTAAEAKTRVASAPATPPPSTPSNPAGQK
jgi:NADH-quinone oxidoreductase subunit I